MFISGFRRRIMDLYVVITQNRNTTKVVVYMTYPFREALLTPVHSVECSLRKGQPIRQADDAQCIE